MSHESNVGKEIVETLSRVLYKEEKVFSFRSLKCTLKYLDYGAVTISQQKVYIAVLFLLIAPMALIFLDLGLKVLSIYAAFSWLFASFALFMTEFGHEDFVFYLPSVKFSKYAEMFPAEVTRPILRDLAGAKSQNEIHEVLLKHNVDKKALVLIEGAKRKK